MSPHISTHLELARVIASSLAEEHMRRHRNELAPLDPHEEHAMAREVASRHLRHHLAPVAWGGSHDDTVDEIVVDAAVAHVLGMGKLQPLLDDDDVSDIHVRGNRPVWVKMRDGRRIEHPPVVASDAELVELIRRMAVRMGHREQRFDPAHPELNLQMADGSRLFATMEISQRPSLVIRRHRFDHSSLGELAAGGMMDHATAQFLAAAVRARRNIVVAGGTGTGKTTLLRALINEIPRTERIVTIEDAFEIGLEHFEAAHPDHDCLQARGTNTEGLGEVTMSDLARMALRMDPDRVIVGEVRGAEAFPMLLAMSQGNNGSMCTIHADHPRSVFPRLLAYVAMAQVAMPAAAVNALMSTTIHFVVHIEMIEGVRRISSIHEVVEGDAATVSSNEVFSLRGTRPDFVSLRDETCDALERSGFARPRELVWA